MKTNNNKLSTTLIIAIIIFILLTHIVYAKYMSVEKISVGVKVANPIFIVEGKEITKISEINNIGCYEFTIKNFDDSNISEIGFVYTIEIISNTDESIQFQLYSGDKEIPLKELKTTELSIKGNEKVEQNYKLKVTYDCSKGTEGKEILEEVQVKVHSEQEIKTIIENSERKEN